MMAATIANPDTESASSSPSSAFTDSAFAEEVAEDVEEFVVDVAVVVWNP
jgi:hypothetical protein